MIKRVLLAASLAVLVLLAVVFGRALTASSRQLDVAPVEPVALDEAAVLERLSAAIQIPTVTVNDGPLRVEPGTEDGWTLTLHLSAAGEGGHSSMPPRQTAVGVLAAATMFSGSPKNNVLPQRAEAAVNFRFLPCETVESVKTRVGRVIDDARVRVELDAFGSDRLALLRWRF